MTRGAKAAKARVEPAPEPTGEAAGRKTAAVAAAGRRPAPTEVLVARVREELGEEWPARLYRERILPLRTRSHALPPGGASSAIEILHTLLGVELKVGRRRISCPDLATARYLRVFARTGAGAVAVPYDITKISRLADDLESAWQRTLLVADHLTENQSPRSRSRSRSAVVAELRREVEEAGAGAAVPQFNQNTRQRPERIQTDERTPGRRDR
ncbi:MAG TPA: hypothetical protein VEY09_00895 [Pyrinomonadaceae bacterium]|nr:hypothetical protein [Pyrinomonadaceae bacterium]